MRLATLRTESGTRAVKVVDEALVDLGAPDVGSFLQDEDWRSRAEGAEGVMYARRGATFAAPVARPGKVLCVGLNYSRHITEMGHPLPTHPTLFAKFAESIIGPTDHIMLPPESAAMDWEAELAVVIGKSVRRADATQAADAIAGFSILNDITARDWQYRTEQWLQGKTFESTTPVGPVLVTPDELPGGVQPSLQVTATVGGELVQDASTADLVFPPVELVRYASTILTLQPGDLISTGTPAGVGHGRRPPKYLSDGDVVITEISHIGRLINKCVT